MAVVDSPIRRRIDGMRRVVTLASALVLSCRRLPLIPSEETPRAEAPLARASRPQGVRILVVDDNEDGAEMLRIMLTYKGFETRTAHDGPTALQIAKEYVPHVAVLDIGLPVMDGYELAARLREMPEISRLGLIAVTGYGRESDFHRTRLAGFHHHLVKPVSMETLDATVITTVERLNLVV